MSGNGADGQAPLLQAAQVLGDQSKIKLPPARNLLIRKPRNKLMQVTCVGLKRGWGEATFNPAVA